MMIRLFFIDRLFVKNLKIITFGNVVFVQQ